MTPGLAGGRLLDAEDADARSRVNAEAGKLNVLDRLLAGLALAGSVT